MNFDIFVKFFFNCYICFLVSYFGMLFGSNVGLEIDFVDCVFRLNFVFIFGYERDVGRRIIVWVVLVIGFKFLIRDFW